MLKKNGSDVKTIIFAGDYEKFIDNGVTRELYYIGAPDGLAAIYVKPEIGAASIYYAHTDHLGSIVSLTDSAGVAVFKASYDAWGRQTVSLNTIGFYRGYTGHEHLPEFGLINMNGRMFDPVLGRFLSPDNYVQAADYSQSYNRYSYCVNNPLKYTDPSGDLFWIIPNIGWSKDGGLSIGLSFVVGIPGGLSAQTGIGYNFGSNDAYGFVGATSSMNTWHASFSTTSGVSVGNTFGLSPFSGLPISTNFATVGVNYNISQNSGSGNVSAWQVGQNGFSFNPSASVMIFPEHTTNFVRKGEFINNDAMLNRFTNGSDYQGALDYFGFKGTYDPDNELFNGGGDPGVVDPKTGDIYYNKTAFNGGFDKLYFVVDHEGKHNSDVRSGKYKNLALTKQVMAGEEFNTWEYNYKRQGFYRNHGYNIGNILNMYGSAAGINPDIILRYSFYQPWWHSIYKIPRRW